MPAGDRAKIRGKIAHDLLDDGAAHPVFGGGGKAPHNRRFPPGNGLAPGQGIAGRLGEALRKFGNGAGPEGQQRIGRIGGVALEIAAQGSGGSGHCQGIIGKGEVVEANGGIAGMAQFLGDGARPVRNVPKRPAGPHRKSCAGAS